ncbi:Protein kinase domain-containing protein [Aphelenchoides fujianensis]|nr:Protein kinase domain-containing protein [Aphelenchoides fujianensis]
MPQSTNQTTTSNAGGGSKEQVAKQFGRSFIELVEIFLDEKDRVNTVYSIITALHGVMDTETRVLVLKKVLMHFLKKFSNDSDELLLNDDYIRKMLQLWKIFGQCSHTMGTCGILEKIEDQYADCWQYYQVYAEALIRERKTDNLYELFKKCSLNCELSEEAVREKFGPNIMKHVKFPDAVEEDEATVQFMQAIRQNDVRKSLAARRRSSIAPSRLDIVLERSEDNVSVERAADHPNAAQRPPSAASRPLGERAAALQPQRQNPAAAEVVVDQRPRLSVRDSTKKPTPLEARPKSSPAVTSSTQNSTLKSSVQPSPASSTLRGTSTSAASQRLDAKRRSPPPVPQSPAVNYSMTSQIRRGFQETLSTVFHEPTQMTTTVAASEAPTPPRDDFTVFKDPTLVKTNASVGVKQPHRPSVVPLSPATQSPLHKRGRIHAEESFDMGDETLKDALINGNLASVHGANKENGEKRNSFDPNSPTVCGIHKLASNQNHMTSTPNSSFRFPKSANKRRTIGLFDQPPGTHSRSQVAPASTTKSSVHTAIPPHMDLEHAVNRMQLGRSSEDVLETTGNGSVSLEFHGGEINPWNEADRADMLRRNKLVVQQHDFTNERCPHFLEGHSVSLGGEQFHVLKQIGQGGFAKVFKCRTDNHFVAIKYQVPPCPFEVHMVESIRRVMPPKLHGFLMDLQDAYIYRDASAIVYEFLPYGTLLDLANTYRIQGKEISGMIVSLVGFQLGTVLKTIHDASIIHGDLKPDNVLITGMLPDDLSAEQMLGRPLVRLIDFGRAIDMQYYRGKTFTGKAKTQCFDCVEMTDGRPWTYQTDFFGFVSIVYLLMHHQYMKVKKEGEVYKTWHAVKRRLLNGELWTRVFEDFLNIPSCSRMPDWTPVLAELRDGLVDAARRDAAGWKQSIVWLNRMIKSSADTLEKKK